MPDFSQSDGCGGLRSLPLFVLLFCLMSLGNARIHQSRTSFDVRRQREIVLVTNHNDEWYHERCLVVFLPLVISVSLHIEMSQCDDWVRAEVCFAMPKEDR